VVKNIKKVNKKDSKTLKNTFYTETIIRVSYVVKKIPYLKYTISVTGKVIEQIDQVI